MIFFVGNDGTVLKGMPSPVYQGAANANTIYLIAPFAANLTAAVAFQLPNGVATAPAAMTPQGEIAGVKDADGNSYSGWMYDLPNAVTALYGTVIAQFFFYSAQNKAVASAAVNFEVGRGVPQILPAEPSDTIYEQLLAAISGLQSDVNNGFYAARAIYAWNSAYTYGAGEITFYPSVGEFGAFVQSVQTGNQDHIPYDEEGALDSEWWKEIVNFNDITDDFFETIKAQADRAEAAAQEAETAASDLTDKNVIFVDALPSVGESGNLYAVVSDATENLFNLYLWQDGEWALLGTANLVSNGERTYLRTLAPSAWVNNTQAITLSDVTENVDICVIAADDTAADFTNAKISAQAGDGEVIFNCEEVPSVNVSVYIVVKTQAEVPNLAGYYTKPQVDAQVQELNSAITAESAARTAADASLQSAVSSLESDVSGILEDLSNKEHFRGYKATTAEVQQIPNPDEGDYAWNAQTGTVWAYNNGAWTDTSEAIPDQTVPKSTTTPLMDGTASVGTQTAYAAGDHRHPTDTTRAAAADLTGEIAARTSADTALGERITDIEDGTTAAGVAEKVEHALTVTVNGAAVVFDGSEAKSVSVVTEGGFEQVPVSIAASAWVEGSYTVSTSSIAENSLVQWVADDASSAAAIEANVRLTGQTAGSATFSCDSTPSVAITGMLIIFN